jgi:alkylation response protein AidB-like acyl-CoA dehydrogenase
MILTENIIHLVLARSTDSPAGTKGISLFLVPKFIVNEDGTSRSKKWNIHRINRK